MAERERWVVLAEIDTNHEPPAPDLGHLVHRRHRPEQLAEQADLRL
jgi:hypothetical protein